MRISKTRSKSEKSRKLNKMKESHEALMRQQGDDMTTWFKMMSQAERQ